MIITKMALPRRTFLRGIGTAIALPLLDAMVPALSAIAKTAAAPVRRVGFVYFANGAAISEAAGVNYWKPKGVGTGFELSPILTPLAPFRDRLTVVSGLRNPEGDGKGEHSRGTAMWLNGVDPKRTEGADVQAGTTADQLAAQELGKDTPLPSLELATDLNIFVGNCDNGYSCAYMNTLAWRNPTTPLPTENDPRVVFARLFGDGGTLAQRRAQSRKSRSILDGVMADVVSLERTLGPADRTRVGEYLDAVREVERRIQKVEGYSADSPVPVLARPVGIPERFSDHVTMLFDLQWLAYQADLTRVVTFMLGRELGTRTFPEIGIPDVHHPLSHHRDDPRQLEKLAKLSTFLTELFASFLQKMQSTPDGDGSLLDHSILLYGGGLSDPNVHSHIDLPLALVGGGAGRLKGGRHLQYAPETPMSNLLLNVLEKVDVRIERLGNSTGRLADI